MVVRVVTTIYQNIHMTCIEVYIGKNLLLLLPYYRVAWYLDNFTLKIIMIIALAGGSKNLLPVEHLTTALLSAPNISVRRA